MIWLALLPLHAVHANSPVYSPPSGHQRKSILSLPWRYVFCSEYLAQYVKMMASSRKRDGVKLSEIKKGWKWLWQGFEQITQVWTSHARQDRPVLGPMSHNAVVEKKTILVNVHQTDLSDGLLPIRNTHTSSYKYRNNSRWILSNQKYHVRKESSRERSNCVIADKQTDRQRGGSWVISALTN